MFQRLFGGEGRAPLDDAVAQPSGANGGGETPKVYELDSNTITQAVIDQMATTQDPRLREIMEAAVRHIHDFAREVKLRPDEWLFAMGYLTRVGQMCTPDRQEYILLSDTLGLSALVNMMHDKTALELGTDTSLLGPFFRENAPRFNAGDQIASDTSAGEIAIYGKVVNANGEPIANAEIGIWQTASDGLYDIQSAPDGEMDCRGIFHSDQDGNYLIRTVRARDYSVPLDGPVGEMIIAQKRHGMRPAHWHFLISAPDYRELVTALYASDSAYLASDTVFGSSSKHLVAWVRAKDEGSPLKGMPAIRYDFKLSRMSEADRATGRVGADPAQLTAR